MFDFFNELTDFKNVVNDYRYTVIGGEIIYVQGFKEIVSFSNEMVLLRLNKNSLKIYGKNLIIKELNKTSISVNGKIDSVVSGANVKWTSFFC